MIAAISDVTERRDTEADVQRAAALAAEAPGVASVRPYSREESAQLLEPWLGSALSLGDLPVPRLIVLRVAPGAAPDFTDLRRKLADIPGATLDDHRAFVERMRAMSRSAVGIGLAVLGLVFAAAMMSVMFATRGAMAANRPIVEVLHLIGAKDGFIAGEFQRHFLLLGMKGGAIGGGIAMIVFAIAGFAGSSIVGTVAGDQFTSLFGAFTIGWQGYATIVALVMLIAIVTAAASRHTVNQTLESV